MLNDIYTGAVEEEYMKEKNTPVTYETCYKHKLNMLEPGTIMLKWIGIVLLAGFVLRLLRLRLASYIIFGLAGAVFLLLLILLAIEVHQDNVLNEIAAQEHKGD